MSRAAWMQLLALVLWTGSAAAQEGAPRERALDRYEAARQAYRDGKFEESIRLLQEAYAEDPNPILLYNQGRAYEGLGNLPAALAAYERYLADEPKVPDRAALEQRVATIRRELEARRKLERERDAARRSATLASRPAPPRPSNPIPWILGGVGVAGIGAGVVLRVIAERKHDDAVEAGGAAEAVALQSDGETLVTWANVAFIGGAALATAGAAWLAIDVASTRPAPRAAVAVVVHPAGLSLQGGF